MLLALAALRARLRGADSTAGAMVIVVDEAGRLLLVRTRYRRGWGLPGGFVHHREDPRVAAAREVREEVGLRLGDLEEVAVYTRTRWPHVDHLFSAQCSSATPLRPRVIEIARARWFEAEALPDLTPEAEDALRRWTAVRARSRD